MKTLRKANNRKELTKRPVSDLGRRLLAIRKKIEASGQPLLTMEEIEREVMERRGGLDPGGG